MLNKLLIESRKFSSEYSDQLSNHLPMALIALERIGASDQELLAFFNNYTPRLKSQSSVAFTIDSDNWTQFLGLHLYNSEYREYFLNEIKIFGKEYTIDRYVTVLIPGLSGGAFHPLIRLAYALEIQCEWEMAEAMAAWCMAFQELGIMVFDRAKLDNDPLSILNKISQDDDLKSVKLNGPNIFTRMNQIAKTESFNKYINQLNINKTSLEKIANSALQIYASSNDDFTALHCVTVAHAARVLLPYTKDNEYFLRYLWQGIGAAYATLHSENHSFQSVDPIPDQVSWEQILSKAKTSRNDHVIKFCYTAYQEQLHYGDALYKFFAAKKAGVIN